MPPLKFNTTLEEIDDNDGITVIDLSDLDRSRYCFAFPGRTKSTPLRASEYLAKYYKLQRNAEDGEYLRSLQHHLGLKSILSSLSSAVTSLPRTQETRLKEAILTSAFTPGYNSSDSDYADSEYSDDWAPQSLDPETLAPYTQLVQLLEVYDALMQRRWKILGLEAFKPAKTITH